MNIPRACMAGGSKGQIELLKNMEEAERTKFIANAGKHRSSYLKIYHRKSAAIKKTCAERLQQNKEKKEAKQRLLTKQAAENTAQAVKIRGMICTEQMHVDQLVEKNEGKRLEQALLCQLKGTSVFS